MRSRQQEERSRDIDGPCGIGRAEQPGVRAELLEELLVPGGRLGAAALHGVDPRLEAFDRVTRLALLCPSGGGCQEHEGGAPQTLKADPRAANRPPDEQLVLTQLLVLQCFRPII
jgi:hypothetical protein